MAKVTVRLDKKALEKALAPFEQIAEQANAAAAAEATPEGKASAFAQVMQTHGIAPDEDVLRQTFADRMHNELSDGSAHP